MKTEGHGDDFKLMGVSGEDPTDDSEADLDVDAGDDTRTVSLEDTAEFPPEALKLDRAGDIGLVWVRPDVTLIDPYSSIPQTGTELRNAGMCCCAGQAFVYACILSAGQAVQYVGVHKDALHKSPGEKRSKETCSAKLAK
ncbi:hypothetical protein AOLI_G00091380 [Acnodon oligacanthus]